MTDRSISMSRTYMLLYLIHICRYQLIFHAYVVIHFTLNFSFGVKFNKLYNADVFFILFDQFIFKYGWTFYFEFPQRRGPHRRIIFSQISFSSVCIIFLSEDMYSLRQETSTISNSFHLNYFIFI